MAVAILPVAVVHGFGPVHYWGMRGRPVPGWVATLYWPVSSNVGHPLSRAVGCQTYVRLVARPRD